MAKRNLWQGICETLHFLVATLGKKGAKKQIGFILIICGFLFLFVEIGSHHVALSGLEFTINLDGLKSWRSIQLALPPDCCNKGMSHHTQLNILSKNIYLIVCVPGYI